MSKRYECKLSEELLAKAVDELHEPADNNERLSRIDQLRDAFINQDCGFELLRNDDEFILRFLRARKFDQARALTMMTNYHKQRDSWPEVFDNVKNPALVKHVLDAGCFISINGNAIDGSFVCIGRPGKAEHAVMTEFIATVVLTMEQLLEDEAMQIRGLTVIEDLSYFGIEMAPQMGPSLAKRFISLMQDTMPIRVKALNMVNEPKLFDIIFAVVRPFMREKMKKRLHMHGSTFDLLHKMVDPSVLPPAYGGKGLDLDGVLSESWKDKILGEDTYL